MVGTVHEVYQTAFLDDRCQVFAHIGHSSFGGSNSGEVNAVRLDTGHKKCQQGSIGVLKEPILTPQHRYRPLVLVSPVLLVGAPSSYAIVSPPTIREMGKHVTVDLSL